MKEMTATEVSRNFRSVLNEIEFEGEEIVLTRNRRRVARLIPEPSGQDALEVFGDLYRTLDEATAEELLKGIEKARGKGRKVKGTLKELRDPWVS